MEGEIRVGTCGFRLAKEKYIERFSTVEIQHTFYTPPSIPTLERWRKEAAENFEFTIKAWQAITHEGSSPTYRRLKKPLSEKQASEAGEFRWNSTVRDAWQTTLNAARALRSRIVLFQCPAKFLPSKINLKRLDKFFSSVDRSGLDFAWEPRGVAWTDEIVSAVCHDLDLWHAVDPFSRRSVTPDRCYFRMHGRVRWRYEYELGELEELATMLPENSRSYVFFNNISMTADAANFERLAKA